jgi:hypothetical protein
MPRDDDARPDATARPQPTPRGARLDELGRTLTDRVLDGALGTNASPSLRRAARETLAPWAEALVVALDETLRIPGTRVHVGLDPIVGLLVPGLGDAITGTGSIALLALALKERVPTVALLRMLLNIGVDTVLGTLPLVGDVFDLFWRSNRRNLDLIRRYRDDPKARPSVVDHAIVALGVVLAVTGIVLPIVIVYGLGLSALVALARALGGG